MEITKFIISLIFLVLVVWLGKTLNKYSLKKYRFSPIQLKTIFIGIIPYFLLIGGYFLSLRENNLVYLYIAILLSIISALGLFLWIAKRSSKLLAAGATLFVTILGLPTVMFLFFTKER